MTNNEERFNSKEFKEVLGKYENARDRLDGVFFDVDDIVDIAEYYLYRNNLKEAENVTAYAATLYPHSVLVLSMQARMAMFYYNDIGKARELVKKIEAEDCEDMEYYYLRAEIMINDDKINEADKFLESKIAMLDGDDLADFFIEVPNIFIDNNLPELAQKWLERSDEKDDPDYKEIEARIAFQTANYDKAERLLKGLLENSPFSASLWKMLAATQFVGGNVADSVESCEYAIAIDPSDVEAIGNKARALSTLARFNEAMVFYERYLKQVPHDAPMRVMYAIALAGVGDNEGALKNLYMAKTDCTDRDTLSDISSQIIYVLSIMGKYDEALVFLGNSEKHGDITRTARLLSEGRIRLDMGETQKAADCFAEAFICSRNDMDTYIQTAMAYFDKGGVQQAIHTLLAGVTINPDTKRGYSYLADCYRLTGEKEKFIDAMAMAVKYNPVELVEVLGTHFPAGMSVYDYINYAKDNM